MEEGRDKNGNWTSFGGYFPGAYLAKCRNSSLGTGRGGGENDDSTGFGWGETTGAGIAVRIECIVHTGTGVSRGCGNHWRCI